MSADRTYADDIPRRTLANPARVRAFTGQPGGHVIQAWLSVELLDDVVATAPERAPKGPGPC